MLEIQGFGLRHDNVHPHPRWTRHPPWYANGSSAIDVKLDVPYPMPRMDIGSRGGGHSPSPFLQGWQTSVHATLNHPNFLGFRFRV